MKQMEFEQQTTTIHLTTTTFIVSPIDVTPLPPPSPQTEPQITRPVKLEPVITTLSQQTPRASGYQKSDRTESNTDTNSIKRSIGSKFEK